MGLLKIRRPCDLLIVLSYVKHISSFTLVLRGNGLFLMLGVSNNIIVRLSNNATEKGFKEAQT